MAFKDLLDSKWLIRLLLVSWIISAVLVIYMVNNLDLIVHGTLYNFGLQFNNLWANSYWMYLNLIYVSLGATFGIAFFAMMVGFYRSRPIVTQTIKVPEKIEKPKISKLKRLQQRKQVPKAQVDNVNVNNMIISCPNCKKVFGRPMVMLNFEGGKTRLVNVCPYCNHGLDQINDGDKSDPEFHIRGQDETESDRRLERY